MPELRRGLPPTAGGDDSMSSLNPRSDHVTDQVLAVLASEYPLPVSTGTVADRTGYGSEYRQLVYRTLNRLARRDDVEKIALPDKRSRYWRLADAPTTNPPGRSHSHGRQ